MALKEETKEELTAFFAMLRVKAPLEYEACLQAGPVKLLDQMLKRDIRTRWKPSDEDMVNNRQEAEQFLAGLWGMC